jgi:hypothetical protein
VNVEDSVAALRKENIMETQKRLEKSGVFKGGRYKPNDCHARHKVAIVVPYRRRKDQLDIFVGFMHPFLQRQQLEYAIFVVEQSGKLKIPSLTMMGGGGGGGLMDVS